MSLRQDTLTGVALDESNFGALCKLANGVKNIVM
jgi:hypothetical protein